MYDRDWYRERGGKSPYSLPESVKEARTAKLRGRLADYSAVQTLRRPRSTTLASTLLWLTIFSFVLAVFFWKEAAQVSVAGGMAEVTVQPAADGHYYVDGLINGHAVRFMIDTGASYVSISAGAAAALGVFPEKSATFNTANGAVAGQVASKQSVTVTGLSAPPLTVVVMPNLKGEALLGQNFLRHITMTQAGHFLVLRGETHLSTSSRFDSRTRWAILVGVVLLGLTILARRLG